MDFNQPVVVVGTDRSSGREPWAGVVNNDSPSPTSPYCMVGWWLAGKGEYLLATTAQSSRVDEQPQKCVWCAWTFGDHIQKFVQYRYHK
jgi:hypothetical protein